MTFDADVGKARPIGMSPLHQRGKELVVPERGCDRRPNVGLSFRNQDQELLEDLAEDLEYLIVDSDAAHIDDLPWRTQRHVEGLGEWFGCLLRKVSRDIACYYDSHAPHD